MRNLAATAILRMKYALLFIPKSCRYTVHAASCSAATDVPDVRHRLGEFDSVAAARTYANQDESEKAGEPTKAIWRQCNCTKAKVVDVPDNRA